MRIGQGYDAHRFEAGKPLVLGGVPIDHDQGLKAHSDGDVLIHALCDALLGAAGLGDIGRHFPDSDPALAGVDSRELLRSVVKQLQERGWGIANVDLTAVAQRPKLSPYIDAMRQVLAVDLQVNPHQINVKATTTEGLGMVGRGEGIAAECIVLVERK